jgi:hypothetical protein
MCSYCGGDQLNFELALHPLIESSTPAIVSPFEGGKKKGTSVASNSLYVQSTSGTAFFQFSGTPSHTPASASASGTVLCYIGRYESMGFSARLLASCSQPLLSHTSYLPFVLAVQFIFIFFFLFIPLPLLLRPVVVSAPAIEIDFRTLVFRDLLRSPHLPYLPARNGGLSKSLGRQASKQASKATQQIRATTRRSAQLASSRSSTKVPGLLQQPPGHVSPRTLDPRTELPLGAFHFLSLPRLPSHFAPPRD